MINYNDRNHKARNRNIAFSSFFLIQLFGCVLIPFSVALYLAFYLIYIPIALMLRMCGCGFYNRPLFPACGENDVCSKALFTSTLHSTVFDIAIFSTLAFFMLKKYTELSHTTTCLIAFLAVPAFLICFMTLLSVILYSQRSMGTKDKDEACAFAAVDMTWANPLGLIVQTLALIIGTISDAIRNRGCDKPFTKGYYDIEQDVLFLTLEELKNGIKSGRVNKIDFGYSSVGGKNVQVIDDGIEEVADQFGYFDITKGVLYMTNDHIHEGVRSDRIIVTDSVNACFTTFHDVKIQTITSSENNRAGCAVAADYAHFGSIIKAI